MSLASLIDLLENYLPPYLSLGAKSHLKSCLRTQFPKSHDSSVVYLNTSDDEFYSPEILQGNIYKQMPFIEVEYNPTTKQFSTDVIYENAMIISTSCHNSNDNKSLLKSRVVYARVYDLNSFNSYLVNKGVDQDKVTDWLITLKNNEIASCMYLPAFNNGQVSLNESFIRFDEVNRMPIRQLPISAMNELADGNTGMRIGGLRLYGFYLMIIKLTYFYSRFSEKLNRFS